MSRLLPAFRVLATVVGLLLIPLFLGWGVQLWGSGEWHEAAEELTHVLGPVHGMLYMLFFIVAVFLAYREAWDLPFTIVTLLCGTVPVLSFWAEHRATQRVRAEAAADAAHDVPVA